MGEDFYCILKLVSGEEILSLIMVDENDGDPIIVLQNPITMKSYHNHHGTHIKVKSWMELASDDFFMIKMDKIITMTETKDKKLIEIYNEFIKDDDTLESYTLGGSVKPSTKMGYISSVEDARSNLEKIFKGIKES
jgi:hypothetical protein